MSSTNGPASTALTVYTGDGAKDDSSVTYRAGSASGGAGHAGTCSFVGLSNQGATCYMNSLLQTLYMTPEFRSALYKWEYDESRDGSREQCIALQLQRLFGLLQLGSMRSTDTVALTKSFGWEGTEVFQQQDVQELCRVLFDALEETFRGTAVDNMIDRLYAGELVDYLKCVGVDYQSDRRDKFLDYSLAITPFGSDVAMHSIHECIEHFLDPEILDGENQYYVESAGRKADAIKGLKFGRLPQIMSVQLKRFVYDFSGESIVHKKINDEVRFPFILDLNRYVSSAGEADGGSDAFERFLADRIRLLRQKRRSSSVDSTDAPVTVDASVQPAVADVPDLVDSEGELCPEQLAERLVSAVEESEDEKFQRRCYSVESADSFSAEELQELIQQRGPWVYELFAVMIHSGAIAGGHYYAYIKDLSSEQWFDFDDSRVSEIEQKKVKDAWGGNIAVPTTYNTSFYGHVSTSHSTNVQSSANAYMLMYRRVKSTSEEITAMPTDDEVPKYVREELRFLEEQEAARKKQDEERFNKLVVKIMWEDKEHTVTTNRKKTYVEFLTQLWSELNVINSPKLADWKSSHPPIDAAEDVPKVPLDRIRLRQYNTYLKVAQDVHDVESKGECTLQSLQILDYRSLTLQCRAAGEEWDNYIQNGVNMLALIYNPESDDFAPGINIRMKRDATVLELKQELKELVGYEVADMRVMKLSALGVSDVRKDELADDSAELELNCRIYEGTKIFVENKSDYSFDDSPAVKCFVKSINTITVNISSIGKTHFDIKLVVDRRITFEEFRKKIAEEVKMEPNTFRIHRHIVKGQELQYAGHETLQMIGVYDGVSLALSEGTPLKPGFCSIALVLYDNRCPGGTRSLTGLSLEEATKHYAIEGSSTRLRASQASRLDAIDEVAEAPSEVEGLTSTLGSVNLDSMDSANRNDIQVDVGYEDSVVVAESAWSPPQRGDKACDVATAVGVVPFSLPELVVQENAPGLTRNLSTENEPDDTSSVNVNMATSGDGPDTDISEAIVLSPATSMNILSRAVSGEGGGNTDGGASTPPSLHGSNVGGDDGVNAEVPEGDPAPADDKEDMFGYSKVDLAVYSEQFTPLMKAVVEGSYLVSDLRKDALCKLVELGHLAEGSPAGLVRLREKWNIRAGGILRDGLSLRQHNVSLVEGREIAVQILSSPTVYDIPSVPNPVQGDCILFVQRWHRTTWTLGEKMEVYIPGTWPVHVIAGCLAELVGIEDFKNMKVLIIQPHNHISISALAENIPSDGRRWTNVSSEKSRMYDMQWYLTNGDLLLLQDSSEPLKQLTEKERMSTLRAREAEGRAISHFSSSYFWPEESDTITVAKPVTRPVGIHIRKHTNYDQKDRQPGSPVDFDVETVDENNRSSPNGPADIEGHDDNEKSKNVADIRDMI